MTKRQFPQRGSPSYFDYQKLLASKEILTIQEAASYLDISINTIYKLTSNKTWPLYKPGGKKIYIKREDIDIWLNGQRTKRVSNNKAIENYFLNNDFKH